MIGEFEFFSNIEMVEAIVVYVFLVLIFLCSFKCIFSRNNVYDKNSEKILGGLVVFIIAIIAKNPYVFIVSLFIGGLIIASEEFMQKLVTILKSESKDIAKNLQPINTPFKKVEERRKNEIKEIKGFDEGADKLFEEVTIKTLEPEENFIIPEIDYDSILPKIEATALDRMEKSLNKKIGRQISFLGLNGFSFSFDGAIVDNNNKYLRLFEVKVFPKLPRNKNGKVMTFAMLENIRKFLFDFTPKLDKFLTSKAVKQGWKHVFTVVVVLNTKTDFIKIRKRIEELSGEFNKAIQNFQINFVFYNLKNINLDLEED